MKDRKAVLFGVVLLLCGAACGVAFYFASARLSDYEAKYVNDHPALRGDLNAPPPSPAEDNQYLLARIDLVGAQQRWMIGTAVLSAVGAVTLFWGIVGTGNSRAKLVWRIVATVGVCLIGLVVWMVMR